MTTSAKLPLTLTTLTLALSLTSCKQPALCPGLGDCGGALPAGKSDWVLNPSHPSCTEDLYTQPADPRLVNAYLPAARTPIPEPTTYDWCLLLVTAPGDDIVAKLPNLFTESPDVGAATLHLNTEDTSFILSTTRTGRFRADFPAYCMRAFGATGDLCGRLTSTLTMKVPTKYKNISCTPNPAERNGCLCDFDLVEREESRGSYLSGGGTMIYIPGNNFPQNVNYCLQGDTMNLTGADGTYLFDRLGLRTMSMQNLPTAAGACSNKVHDLGEDGVDCGPACPIMCSQINCGDLMMGPGEDGVDCGANCPKACP
jgi:hypothetical protein